MMAIAYNCTVWGPGFQHQTEDEIAVNVVKACAMEEESDNEVDEPQECKIMKKLLS